MEWKKVRLGDVVSLYAKTITPKKDIMYNLYSLPAFDNGEKEQVLGKSIQSNKFVVPNKCILYNKLNVRFKRVWRIDTTEQNKICSTEFLPLVVNETMVDYQYLYYVLISDDITGYLCGQNTNTSGSHKRIDITDFLNIEVNIPSCKEQMRIGQSLSALDRKIALNRAINHNLEAMAKQLYDYWFVQFDFPDEGGRPYKSSGGEMVWNERLKREIPKGWEVKGIYEIEQQIITGKTPSTNNEENFNGDIPFITIDDIRKSYVVYETERTLSRLGAESQKKKYLPRYSLCCSCIGTTGIIGYVGQLAQTNQQINSIIFEHPFNREYLFYSLKLHFKHARAKVGNILLNMSKDEFSGIACVYPQIEILQRYHQVAKKILDAIDENVRETNTLTTQRDTLLPLLMNGQVSVNSD